MDLRDKNSAMAVKRIAENNTRVEGTQRAVWDPPKRATWYRFETLQWIGPRILVKVLDSGVSGYVQELYGERIKRYHPDDLKTYCSRQAGQ